MKYWIYLLGALLALSPGCENSPRNYESMISDDELLHQAMKQYSDVIVYDIFSPPVASRNYAYAAVAAYEALATGDSSLVSLSGQLRQLSAAPPAPDQPYSPTVASLEAFYQTAKHFIFSESKLLTKRDEVMSELASQMPKGDFKRSITWGKEIATHIIAWSDGDNYKQTRTFPKYSITPDPTKWRPTPPGYMDGIEPHWKEIRPFVIDSSDQFVPAPPTPYDLTKNGRFYSELMEVYSAVKDADEEQKEIASFWDCNPYVLNVTGHVMHATKKITPGGHWISIVGIASRKAGARYKKSAEAYALTSIALADAFIACWDEKYRSNLVRPETVINEHIDEDWIPLLQTPPFPEHTSGHSVISRAAATALTSIYGDDFSFDDDTEVQYGIPIRSYTSFYHASEEAAISRLYGGIHYRPAIDEGVKQGQQVGDLIVERLRLSAS
ncbi:MAG: vanadium-dependent haloperoxidase [Bacteroidota bacterium]